MNRVICDVCGTKYPETAEQCPICGCAKPENARIAADDAPMGERKTANDYTFVKGGRFSKANVRRRNKAAAKNNDNADGFDADSNPKMNENNIGLVITFVVLLLAVIATMLFVFFKYFSVAGGNDGQKTTTSAAETTTVGTEAVPTTTEPLMQACTSITISSDTIRFDELGDTFKLKVELTPLDTTDAIHFESSDPSVASVSVDGSVTSVSAGEAVITVTCGEIKETCKVVITDPAATTEETVPETTEAFVLEWKLNRTDFTLSKKGETWKLYEGEVPVDDIVFSSDNPAIATFEKGVVTALSNGDTKVHAEYNGEKISCAVHCKVPASTDDTNSSTENEPTTPNSGQQTYDLRIDGVSVSSRTFGNDVTIPVNGKFRLTLCNEAGDSIAVDWSSSKANICSINGNVITGATKGRTTISVTYAGQTYECLVTVN